MLPEVVDFDPFAFAAALLQFAQPLNFRQKSATIHDRTRFAFRTLFSAPETPQLSVASAGCGVLDLLATSEV